MKTILDYTFVIGIAILVIGGLVIVAVQLFSILTSNGQLSVFAMENVAPPVFVIAALTGLVSFFKGYVEKWDSND